MVRRAVANWLTWDREDGDDDIGEREGWLAEWWMMTITDYLIKTHCPNNTWGSFIISQTIIIIIVPSVPPAPASSGVSMSGES